MTESPPSALRTWVLRIVIGLAVSGLIVAALFTQIDFAEVEAVMRRSSVPLIALGFAIYVVLAVVRGWRFRILMPEAPFGSLVAINMIHLLLLRIMPMRTGEIGFAWLMRESGAAGFTKSLVGLVVMRVLDLAAVIVIFAASMVVSEQGATRSVLAASGIAIGGVFMAVLLRPALRVAHRVADRMVTLLRLERFARVERARRSIEEAVAWSSALSNRALFRVTALTVVQWLGSFAFVLVCSLAMRLDVTLAQAVQGGVGTIVTTMLPVPGIGTVGTLEAGWAAGFALAGVAHDDALATAFGYSALSFAYSLATALPAWIWLRYVAARRVRATAT